MGHSLGSSFIKSDTFFRIKPSPMKVEKATPDGKKTTRIKISFREGQLQSPLVDIRNPCSAAKAAVVANAASELETSTASNNRSTSKNGSFKVNESLSNLRQDISSMIEQSFGPFQVCLHIILSQKNSTGEAIKICDLDPTLILCHFYVS